MDCFTIYSVSTIIVAVLWLLLFYVLIKRVESIERARMCNAFVKAFITCPERYAKGAEYISERWIDEMEKMGVDFGRRK